MKLLYNYHTHTSMCGHARGENDEFVEEAIKLGLKRLGFTEHMPAPPGTRHNSNIRLHTDQIEEYYATLKALKIKYQEKIEIISAWEAEHKSDLIGYLLKLRSGVDYMLLAIHPQYYLLELDHFDPIGIAKLTCEAIETGLFDMIAHPDFFLINRDCAPNPKQFLEDAEIASIMICEKAKEYGIPVEINLNGLINSADKEFHDNNIAYPHPLFWEIAAKVGVPVIWGVDAHTPCRFTNFYELKSYIEKYIDITNLNFMDEDYHPVIARSNNPKLKQALTNTRNKLYSEESD